MKGLRITTKDIAGFREHLILEERSCGNHSKVHSGCQSIYGVRKRSGHKGNCHCLQETLAGALRRAERQFHAGVNK